MTSPRTPTATTSQAAERPPKVALRAALARLGVILLAFALLAAGIAFAVIRWTDQTLVRNLGGLPGVAEVIDQRDRVVVRVATDLEPADASQTITNVMLLAKTQQLYRSRPVEVHQGPLVTTMLASPPGVPPGEYRGDAGDVVARLDGIAGGELTPDGEVRVEVAPDAPLDWLLDAARALEEAGVAVAVRVESGSVDERLLLQVGEAADRDLLAAVAAGIRNAGAELRVLSVGRGEFAATVDAADRAVAGAVLAAISPLAVSSELETRISDDLVLRGLGDPAEAFAVADHLQGDGLDVVELRTNLAELSVTADSPDAIDLLVARIAELPLPADGLLRCRPVGLTDGGFDARIANLSVDAAIAQTLWRAGFPEVAVTSGDEARGIAVHIWLGSDSGHDHAAADTQAKVSAALRAADWPGRARITVAAESGSSPLTFNTTADGPATDINWPQRDRDGKERPWGESFVEAWDASA